MSSDVIWARTGKILAALASIAGVVVAISSVRSCMHNSSPVLEAEIRPMNIVIPFTYSEILQGVSSKSTINETLRQLEGSTGLVALTLINAGEKPIRDVKVKIPFANLYVEKTESGFRKLSHNEFGITLPEVPHGEPLIVYVWTKNILGYRSYFLNEEDFVISHSEGVAKKTLFLEASGFALWLYRNSVIVIGFSVLGLLVLSLAGLSLGTYIFGSKNNATDTSNSRQIKESNRPRKIKKI